jgi:DNA modification methylase
MTIHYEDTVSVLHHGDSLNVLAELADESVDAVVCDPPYALDFMGRQWDRWTAPAAFESWCAAWAGQCLRVLKPGGHLLAFGGTRTAHRLAAGIEDAGFEIRDTITWLYASGFPKSHDVSKAIDRAAGADRPVVGKLAAPAANGRAGTVALGGAWQDAPDLTVPATPEAARWAGWGTALKPASEPVVVARKPLAGTVALNVMAHGTGALNIDAARVATSEPIVTFDRVVGDRDRSEYRTGTGANRRAVESLGRWPANVVLSHAEDCGPDRCEPGCPVRQLDEQTGDRPAGSSLTGAEPRSEGFTGPVYGTGNGPRSFEAYGDQGGASRFFPVFRYEAKATTASRPAAGETRHPTVKPVDLMRWLIRLVTPPGGLVLDPFAGSGTTGEAARIEGMRCVLIEREADYLPLIVQRLTRRADTVAHLASKGEDLGLFGLLGGDQ